MRPPTSIKVLSADTYLTKILASVGSKEYRTSWALVDGQRRDLTQGGLLSCAFYLTSIQKQFDLVKSLHTTVDGAIKDMLESGWRESAAPIIPGEVLLWEKTIQRSGEHAHVGFYIGEKRAISHSDKKLTPVGHDWEFGDGSLFFLPPPRKIIAHYTHPLLLQ